MYVPVCDQAFTILNNGNIRCYGTLSIMDTSSILTPFDLTQLDPVILAAAFGAGFSIVGTMSVVGIATAKLLNFIRNPNGR